MCKFCKNSMAGDPMMLAKRDIKVNGIQAFTSELWLERDHLNACVADNTDTYVVETIKKIKYCPMCGQKLQELEAK